MLEANAISIYNKHKRTTIREGHMVTKVAINGFGRIGRNAFKVAFERKDIEGFSWVEYY